MILMFETNLDMIFVWKINSDKWITGFLQNSRKAKENLTTNSKYDISRELMVYEFSK